MPAAKAPAKKTAAIVQSNEPKPKDHLLSNDLYDALKFIALILLPAIGAVYFVVAQVVSGLPDAESVVGIITAVDAALGGFLKVGDTSYKNSTSKFDGVIEVVETDAKKVYRLVLDTDPEFIDQAEQILLQVKSA